MDYFIRAAARKNCWKHKIINDIYSLNIETKKLTQITNDGHIKSCLCILE